MICLQSGFRSWTFLLKRFSKRVPKDKSGVLTNFINENFDRNYNSYIEFSDILSSAESAFEEGKAKSWGALRISVPFRRGMNFGLFLEHPW